MRLPLRNTGNWTNDRSSQSGAADTLSIDFLVAIRQQREWLSTQYKLP